MLRTCTNLNESEEDFERQVPCLCHPLRMLRSCGVLDANVAGLAILVQLAAAVKTLRLVGSANFRGECVFGRFAHHASDSVGDVSEGRVWRLDSSQQDFLVVVAAAPTGHVTGHAPLASTWPLATLAQRRSLERGTPVGGIPVALRVFRGLGPLRSVAGTSSAPRRPERPSP